MADHAPWVTDLTGLCERIARRLADAGARHPTVGAVALAVRGHEGVDRQTFARAIGISHDELDRAEQGDLPFGRLPEPIRVRAENEARIDLARLGLITGPDSRPDRIPRDSASPAGPVSRTGPSSVGRTAPT